MILENRCSPAVIFIAFSLTQIIIDIFKNLYNTALIKFIVMIMYFIILNILCEEGLIVLSWLFVFLPFVMMTIITSLLLFVFGLSPDKGKLKYQINNLETSIPYETKKISPNKHVMYTPLKIEEDNMLNVDEKKVNFVTDLNTVNMVDEKDTSKNEEDQFVIINNDNEENKSLISHNHNHTHEVYSNKEIHNTLNHLDEYINKML
tara:strand:+ start:635 stop:1249 length:615 start_codon:yes stop_codon:yes gene_type:complete